MCNWGGRLADPWMAVCCEAGSTSTYCQPNDMNECSPTKREAGKFYYTHCPLVNATMCGTNNNKNTFQATGDLKSFYFDKMRH